MNCIRKMMLRKARKEACLLTGKIGKDFVCIKFGERYVLSTPLKNGR